MERNMFREQFIQRIKNIYGNFPFTDDDLGEFLHEVDQVRNASTRSSEKWNEQDIILITYGDSLKNEGHRPLKVLHSFLKKHFGSTINYVHILPFYPYSSDDGFSVIDYREVNPELGDWDDIASLGQDYRLMFDLVINHISQHSEWFRNFLKAKDPGKDYFIVEDPATDLSKVVRPRSLPLLSRYETSEGTKYVWTTFSADQIDLNFENPAVLMAMLKVFVFYLARGARIIRLDAIAFLWKEVGTNCLHRPQTHEVVRLMRAIADEIDPGIILLTETNVPNRENLSYFGRGDEADMVYQFSLPPLLLHALYTANSEYLSEWADSISQIPRGCTFFNFTASHDGIGVRPLEGLLPQQEVEALAQAMKDAGGYISTRRNSDGSDSPYELNITYLDALKNSALGPDNFQFERFICSQTLMMSFKGIPAFYIHSLLGTHNDHEGVKRTGMPRSVNRRKWDIDELNRLITREDNNSARILTELVRRIAIRKSEKAFHPDRPQKIYREGSDVFILSRGEEQDLLVVANMCPHRINLPLAGKSWFNGQVRELLSSRKISGHSLQLDPYQVCWLRK